MPVDVENRPASASVEHAPWLAHYPSNIPHHLEFPDKPLWKFLEEAAQLQGARVACHYYDQHVTYHELYRQARRAAAALVRLGVKPGDRVGLLLPNVPEYLVAAYGVWLAGGVVVSLSPLSVAEDISAILRATNCRVVIALDLLAPLVLDGDAPPAHLLLTTLQDRLPRWQRIGYAFARMRKIGMRSRTNVASVSAFSEELAQENDEFSGLMTSRDAPAYILSTGGTTGAPKAVTLAQRNLVANAWQLFHWAGGRFGQDRILAVLPFFHSYGLSTCVTTGVASAATLILHHRFEVRTVLDLIASRRPNIFHAVPAMLIAMNQNLKLKAWDLSSLEYVISGGGPLDPAVAREFAGHTGATVVEGFGLSEASPVTHVGPLDGTARPGMIGFPLPGTDARIVDEETGLRELPPGEVGELIIRGPQVMLGYWNNDEETRKTIRNGWLFTGDLGLCDEDGFFRIVDRKKDMIITSGFKVYPTDVEYVLRQFPGVQDVAVTGAPDPQRGHVVKAALVMKKGVKFDRKAFDNYTRQHLAKHKRPRLVEILGGDLPRNFLGKVLRRNLRGRDGAGAIVVGHDAPVLHEGVVPVHERQGAVLEPLAVVAGMRTPFAKAFGPLAGVPADELGRLAVEAALERAGLKPVEIDEVVFGNVAGPAEASNVARVIAQRAGVPYDRVAHTVNRNCASGLEAVVSAWQALRENRADLIAAGGTESMSNVPLLWDHRFQEWLIAWTKERRTWKKLALLPRLRPGYFKPIPALQVGLTDPICGLNMGQTAELLATEFDISREEQDEYALGSHQRALAAWDRGFFKDEVIPLRADQTGGQPLATDFGPRAGQSLASLARLRPIFEPQGGTVTVGNSCSITDGAAALVLMSASRARSLGCKPLGFVTDYALAGCEPQRMGLGPVYATSLLLAKSKLTLADFDLIEINEAFAAQVLACRKAMASTTFARRELGREQPLGELDLAKLNVNGGAIALGHPVGTSGARLILTLLRALRERGLKRGLAALCIGGGQGVAAIVETTLD